MLEAINRFLFGERPHPDNNSVHYQDNPPKIRGGLLFASQRAVGDLWFDTTTDKYTPHRWNGSEWEETKLIEGE